MLRKLGKAVKRRSMEPGAAHRDPAPTRLAALPTGLCLLSSSRPARRTALRSADEIHGTIPPGTTVRVCDVVSWLRLGSNAIDSSASPTAVCDSWLVAMEHLEGVRLSEKHHIVGCFGY